MLDGVKKAVKPDYEALMERAQSAADAYQTASPFPHGVFDDFLPSEMLQLCLDQFPGKPDPDSETYDRAQERLKTSYNPDHMSPALRQVFLELNSRPFLKVLETLTGIKGLIPDPYFLGGGFHEIRPGGHLDIHADFNLHKPLSLERRINLLIYLNPDWKSEYGGQLELWDRQMKGCEVSVDPLFNRAVMFNTDTTSYHGNPHTIKCPDGMSRKSIALYYYTATWNNTRREHTTQFRVRPGTRDEKDWRVAWAEFMQEIMPPVLFRQWNKVLHRLTRK